MSDHIVQHQINTDLHQKHDSLSCGLTEETMLISVQLNTITHSYREHSHWLHSGIQLQLNNKDDFRLWLAPDNDHDEPGHCGEPVSSVVVLAQIGFSHALMITLDKIWLGFDGWNGNCLTTTQHTSPLVRSNIWIFSQVSSPPSDWGETRVNSSSTKIFQLLPSLNKQQLVEDWNICWLKTIAWLVISTMMWRD